MFGISENLTKVQFTNLNKILYPELEITKSQMIEYYIRVAPKMLGFLSKRPLATNRFPNGVDGKGFYEKDAPMGAPNWVETFKRFSESAKRDLNYVLCNNLDTLLWLANLAALEIHVILSKADSFESPDLALFDIDPEPPAGFDEAITVSLLLKEKLDSVGLSSYVKTSGKKGLHVVVPVRKGYTFMETREFVHKIGKMLAAESENVVSELSESKKPGTVFIDYLQNSHGRTMICPYSLRATVQATVSTPLEWSEVKKGLKPNAFNLISVPRILKDPWRDLLKKGQSIRWKNG